MSHLGLSLPIPRRRTSSCASTASSDATFLFVSTSGDIPPHTAAPSRPPPVTTTEYIHGVPLHKRHMSHFDSLPVTQPLSTQTSARRSNTSNNRRAVSPLAPLGSRRTVSPAPSRRPSPPRPPHRASHPPKIGGIYFPLLTFGVSPREPRPAVGRIESSRPRGVDGVMRRSPLVNEPKAVRFTSPDPLHRSFLSSIPSQHASTGSPYVATGSRYVSPSSTPSRYRTAEQRLASIPPLEDATLPTTPVFVSYLATPTREKDWDLHRSIFDALKGKVSGTYKNDHPSRRCLRYMTKPSIDMSDVTSGKRLY